MRALLVEDEPQLAKQIRQGLETMAWVVDIAENSTQAYAWARTRIYDCIILELWSPLIDGLNLCQRLRGQGQLTPILLLTAPDSVYERVIGLDAGADDCLSKPFMLPELLARLRALCRPRTKSQRDLTLVVADLQLDLRTHQVRRGDQVVDLSAREAALLILLMRHPNRVFTRETILQQVWQQHPSHQTNVVNVLICALRRKIDEPFAVKLIQTVHGLGYLLQNPNVQDGKLSLR